MLLVGEIEMQIIYAFYFSYVDETQKKGVV